MAANDKKNKSGLGKVQQPPPNVFEREEVMELYKALLLGIVELYKDESNESVEKKIIKTTQKLFEYLCKLKDTYIVPEELFNIIVEIIGTINFKKNEIYNHYSLYSFTSLFFWNYENNIYPLTEEQFHTLNIGYDDDDDYDDYDDYDYNDYNDDNDYDDYDDYDDFKTSFFMYDLWVRLDRLNRKLTNTSIGGNEEYSYKDIIRNLYRKAFDTLYCLQYGERYNHEENYEHYLTCFKEIKEICIDIVYIYTNREELQTEQFSEKEREQLLEKVQRVYSLYESI